MMRLTRIWKLFLIYSIVIVVAFSAAGFILEAKVKNGLLTNLKREVLTLSKVIANVLPDTENQEVLDSFCREYEKLAAVRITIIRKNGQVIGESDRGSIGIENHLQRPEVAEALEKGTGSAIRFSKTVQKPMYYVAVLLKERNVFLRLAIPMTGVKRIEDNVMVFMSIAVYVTPLMAILVSLIFARFLTSDDKRKRSLEQKR